MDDTAKKPETREQLIFRGLIQGGALALLAGVIYVAAGHLEALTAVLATCAGRP